MGPDSRKGLTQHLHRPLPSQRHDVGPFKTRLVLPTNYWINRIE